MPHLSRSQLYSIIGLVILLGLLAALFWLQPDDEYAVRDTNTPDSDILDAPDVEPASTIETVDSSELSGVGDISELQDRIVQEISDLGDEEAYEYGVVTLD